MGHIREMTGWLCDAADVVALAATPGAGADRQGSAARISSSWIATHRSPSRGYVTVNVDLQIGSNVGSLSGALTEKPKGSGGWLL